MKRLSLFFFGLVSLNLSILPTQSKTKEACKECIIKHEKQRGIEPGLLEAIVQIESKLHPYAVNACGRAYHFKSAAEAARFVQQKQREGVQNISVGIAQLHVPSHRNKFKNLQNMMEPEENIAYAAKLLRRLKQQTGSWDRAVKRYHSDDPYAAERYRSKVFGAWAKIRKRRGNTAKKQSPIVKTTYIPSEKPQTPSARAFLSRYFQSPEDYETWMRKKGGRKKTTQKKGKEQRKKQQNTASSVPAAYLTCINCKTDTLFAQNVLNLGQDKKVHNIVQTVQ